MFRFIKEKTDKVNWEKGTEKGTEKGKAMERNLSMMKVKKHWMQLMTKVNMVYIQFFDCMFYDFRL